MIKIVHVLSDSNIGGAGKLLYNLSLCIDREQFEFIFIFPHRSKLIKLFVPLKFRIYTFKNGADSSFNIKTIPEIVAIIKKEKPDIVHTHSSLSARIAARISGISRNRNIYTRHCVFGVPTFMDSKPIKILYRVLDDMLSGKAVAVADSARRELVNFGVRAKKINVIINGSHPLKKLTERQKKEVKKSLGIEDGEFVVGISARLEKYKGHKYLLDAAKISLKNNDNFRFIIMGDGSYRYELQKYAAKLGLCEYKTVIFLGFVDDVSKYMNIFDVNINCSIGTETSSLAISEGLSLGIPAIVSDFGGNPNMVRNGETGYVIPKANPKALYEAICKIKNDPIGHVKMKYAAKSDFKKRFSDIRMTEQYEKLYYKIMLN